MNEMLWQRTRHLAFFLISVLGHICLLLLLQELDDLLTPVEQVQTVEIRLTSSQKYEEGGGTLASVPETGPSVDQVQLKRDEGIESEKQKEWLQGDAKLTDLIPYMKGESTEASVAPTIGKESGSLYSGVAQRETYDFMNALGAEQYTPLLPFFRRIWEVVDGVTGYPKEFLDMRISGTVHVHLTLNRKGQIEPELRDVQSSNDFLTVYVLALLHHYLKDPLHKKYWLQRDGTMPVVMSFYFETYSDPSFKKPRDGYHIKNALVFERREFIESKANRFIKQMWSKYIPPILPIPGGFYLDFVSAYELLTGQGEDHKAIQRRERLREFRAAMGRLIQTR